MNSDWIKDRPPTEIEVPDNRPAQVTTMDGEAVAWCGDYIRKSPENVRAWKPLDDPYEPEERFICPVCDMEMKQLRAYDKSSWWFRCPNCTLETGHRTKDEALADVRKLCGVSEPQQESCTTEMPREIYARRTYKNDNSCGNWSRSSIGTNIVPSETRYIRADLVEEMGI